MNAYVRLARIVNTHGIKGSLKIISETDFVDERFKVGNKLYLINKNDQIEVTVESIRQQKGTYIVNFKELNTIEEAEVYKGGWVVMDEEDQHELPEGEYYYHQIEGLEVYTLEGDYLGKIKEILSYGPNDVWVVKQAEKGKSDILLPYIKDVVKDVDLEAGKVSIDLLEGLLPDEN